MAQKKSKAELEAERFNKSLSKPKNEAAPFESNLGSLQRAAKQQKMKKAMANLMMSRLPSVKRGR